MSVLRTEIRRLTVDKASAGSNEVANAQKQRETTSLKFYGSWDNSYRRMDCLR